MYRREETTEERVFSCESRPIVPLEEMGEEIAEAVIPSVPKLREIFLNELASPRGKFNIKRKAANLLNKNEEFSLSLSILFLPYILGFIISYMLFYFYGGMPIESFITIEKGNMHFELWSIGAYLLITAGVIWAVLSLW